MTLIAKRVITTSGTCLLKLSSVLVYWLITLETLEQLFPGVASLLFFSPCSQIESVYMQIELMLVSHLRKVK